MLECQTSALYRAVSSYQISVRTEAVKHNIFDLIRQSAIVFNL